MQTFLTSPIFRIAAACLDTKRLGKQRAEAKMLLTSLTEQDDVQRMNHPACRMWEGAEGALALYGIAVCEEWIDRGYQDTCLAWFQEQREKLSESVPHTFAMPWWVFDRRIHANHRARLLQKNPSWYSQFEWTEAPTKTNLWPDPRGPQIPLRATGGDP